MNALPAAGLKVGLFGLLGSGNFGNNASMETVLSYLRTAHPDAIVDIRGSGAAEQIRSAYGIDATPIYWFSRYQKRTSGPSAVALKALGKGLDIFRTMSWVRRHDAVIVPGAGPLETTTPVRAWGFPLTFFMAALSGKLFGTKVMLVSVGADNIKEPAIRWLSNATARLAYYVSYRDNHSLVEMQRRGVATSESLVFPDLAFGAPTPTYNPGDIKIVGVGVMDYCGGNDDRHRATELHSSYIEKMTTFVNWLVSTGHEVRLFGGDTKFDWDVADQIISTVRQAQPDLDPASLTAERPKSYAELMQLVSPAGTVVATRYHNVMCALKLCKPTISLGYARKFVALMTDMGVPEFNQFADSFSVTRLMEQFEEVKTRHAELRSLMSARNNAKRDGLNDQFALLSEILFGTPKPRSTAHTVGQR